MSNLSLSAVLQIVDEASKPLKLIKQLSDSSSDSIEDLNRSIDRLNQTLGGSNAGRYNKHLQQTEKSSHGVRNATRMLVTEFAQVDNAIGNVLHKFDQWGAKLAQSRQSMRAEFKSLAMGGIVAGAGLYKFFQPAIEFEKQMSGVQAVLDLDKHSAAMKMLEEDARKWGASSSFSPTEAAQAQFNLGSGGFNSDQIHQALGGTLQLAEAGKVGLEQAAEIAVGTLNGFGLAAKEINRVNDVFVQATSGTATSVQGLGETMKYVAPIAKLYGASIEQTTAMVGLLGDNNIKGSEAGTALRGLMLRLAAPPKAAQKALKGLGVTTADANGNLRDMADIFNDIRIKTKNMEGKKRVALLSDISGTEAASAMAVLVAQTSVIDENTGKTVNAIKQLTGELENSEGAAARAAAILKDNLAGDIENMGGAWQDFSISVKKALDADLRKFIQQITQIIDRVKAWVDANPELVRTLANIAMKLIMLKVAWLGVRYTSNLFLGTIVSILAGITKLAIVMWILQKVATKFGVGLPSRLTIMSKIIKLLSRAFIFLAKKALPMVIAGLRALAIAMITNPFTLIIALIASVALLIYRYWGPIKAFFKGFWDGLKIGLAPMIDTFRTAFNNLKATLEPLRPVWDWLVGAWQTFKGVLAECLSPMQASNQELQNATSYGRTLGEFLGSLIGVLAEALVTIGTFFGETAAKVVLFVQDCMVAWGNFKTSVVEVGSTLLNHLLAPVNTIIGAVNTLINTLNKIPAINIPNIPNIPQVGTASAVTTSTQPTTVKPTPIAPLRASAAPSNVTNHFAAAQISITGVSDPKAVSALVDQKLKLHEQMLAGQNNRSYSDLA